MSKAAAVGQMNLESPPVRECCRVKGGSPESKVRNGLQNRTAVLTWMLPYALTLAASILLLVSLKLPLWRMHLEAPQYRGEEALNIAVHPNRLAGDLHEITVLDQYIGVHVPKTLPQFSLLPGLLVAGAALGLFAMFLPLAARRSASALVTCALAAGLALASFQAMAQIRDIGHKRDQKTILAGIKDFTPPFLGTSKIAQFTVNSRFGLGAWLIGGALVSQLGAGWLSRPAKSPRGEQPPQSVFKNK